MNARFLTFTPLVVLALTGTAGCNGCRHDSEMSKEERTRALASANATPKPRPSQTGAQSIGHAANVIPGEGPPRIAVDEPRLGASLPILPGEGLGPIRFGATRATIERLMGGPCDDATETRCLYIGRAIDFTLEGGALTQIRISRKGREAKRTADGSILEYGFFNGAILPDLYFGMHPSAIQEHLGPPQKVETISPMGPDGFNERHVYDGMSLEYDRWSNGNLILGAVVLTKSATAAAKTEQALDALTKKAAEDAERAKNRRPSREPR